MSFSNGQRVELERGLVVTVTDAIDKTAPEVMENQDDLCIGQDEKGRYHVFPEWEVVAILD